MCIPSLKPDICHCSRSMQQPSRWLLFHHAATMPFSKCLACFFTVIMESNCCLLSEAVSHRKTQKLVKIPTCYTPLRIYALHPTFPSPAIEALHPIRPPSPAQNAKSPSILSRSENNLLYLNLYLGIAVTKKLNQNHCQRHCLVDRCKNHCSLGT